MFLGSTSLLDLQRRIWWTAPRYFSPPPHTPQPTTSSSLSARFLVCTVPLCPLPSCQSCVMFLVSLYSPFSCLKLFLMHLPHPPGSSVFCRSSSGFMSPLNGLSLHRDTHSQGMAQQQQLYSNLHYHSNLRQRAPDLHLGSIFHNCQNLSGAISSNKAEHLVKRTSTDKNTQQATFK